MRSREGLTSFKKDISAIFSNEKNYIEAFRRVYVLRIREKDVKLNLVLVVALVLARVARSMVSANQR